jgi:hypothetical protein
LYANSESNGGGTFGAGTVAGNAPIGSIANAVSKVEETSLVWFYSGVRRSLRV